MSLPTIPDYNTSIKTPALIHPSVLAGGHPIEKGVNIVKYAGGFCVVFPYQTPSKKYAVRCWHAEVADAKRRTKIIADSLKNSNLPYFVGFDYYEDGIMTPMGVQPIVVMDWVDAMPLKKFLKENICNPQTINAVADNFLTMVADLHKNHFSHGDLQHGNIMVKPDKSLVLVDYDSMYVPELKGSTDDIKGLAGYQHESRWTNEYVTEKADYFSELVIYLSLKALAKYPRLWDDLSIENTETLLFSAEDIKSKGQSDIFHRLNSDSDLSSLSEKLIEFMNEDCIDNLCPLENAVVSKTEAIAGKWKNGNGYNPSSKPSSEIDDPINISSKWKNGNGHSPELSSRNNHESILNNIVNKFKNPD